MLDHVEVMFEDMKPMMKKLKKASYKENMVMFQEKYGHFFSEMTDLTEHSEDKESSADEIARTFAESVEKKFQSPKKKKIDGCVQLDLNFFMIYYVFPALLKTGHEDAALIADRLCSEWGRRFKDSQIGYTDYDTLYSSFKEKIFGIF